jgi:hypothetical protein
MYLELKITADYGSKQIFLGNLLKEIGPNNVTAAAAIQHTPLQRYASMLIPKVIAAEQIQYKIFILYWFEGADTISAHISGGSVAETKEQAVRIARRMPALFENLKVKTKVKAVIYAANPSKLDIALLSGERVSKWERLFDAFTERWMARIVTPGLVFSVAAKYLPGSSFFQSALIGFVAAIVTVLIESTVFAYKAEDWKWKEI